MDTSRTNAEVHGPDGEPGIRTDFSGSMGALGRYRDRLRMLVREHPTSSVLMALVAGYLVGRLIRA